MKRIFSGLGSRWAAVGQRFCRSAAAWGLGWVTVVGATTAATATAAGAGATAVGDSGRVFTVNTRGPVPTAARAVAYRDGLTFSILTAASAAEVADFADYADWLAEVGRFDVVAARLRPISRMPLIWDYLQGGPSAERPGSQLWQLGDQWWLQVPVHAARAVRFRLGVELGPSLAVAGERAGGYLADGQGDAPAVAEVGVPLGGLGALGHLRGVLPDFGDFAGGTEPEMALPLAGYWFPLDLRKDGSMVFFRVVVEPVFSAE